MSVEAVSLVLACFPHGGGMKLLAVALADAATQEGANIFKSVATLATHSGQSERTVQRMLPRLVADGWLIVDGDAHGGRGRTNVYRISEEWMSCAHYECGHAKAERRQPNPVPFRSGELELSTKGDKLAPFTDDKRVTNQTQKGDKNELKGDKSALKGDIHVSPEHRTLNVLTNTPLPPTGGDRAVETKSGERLPAEEKPSDADALLAKLIAIHPKHDPAHTPQARRALAKITDPAQRAQLAARLRVDAASPNWQSDGGRFAPKLSKWLAGTAELLALPASERPPDADGKDAIEARAVARGLARFDDWMVQQSLAGKPPSWALYCRAANGGAA